MYPIVQRKFNSPREVWRVLTGAASGGAAFSTEQIRLPRAILALLARLAFGAARSTSQLMLRNRLASPDIIGITSGSSTAAIIAILVWGWSGMAVNILALVAGLTTALLVFLLAGSGSAQGGRLILRDFRPRITDHHRSGVLHAARLADRASSVAHMINAAHARADT